MAEISVIVPIYNVENYLERCLESIINQKFNDLEIILVNDGSTDKSRLICEHYKERDRRIIVINKDNGGLSDARNSGLRVATGKYIGFVDSDDWIDYEFYYILHNIAKETDADVISALYTSTAKEGICAKNKHMVQVLSGDEVLKHYLKSAIKGGETYVPCWSKIYKKEIIEKIIFRKGKLYEDIMFNWELFNCSVKYAYCDYKGYFYYINVDSITRKKFNRRMYELYDVAEYIKECYKGSDLEILKLIKQFAIRVDYSIFVKMLSSGYSDIKEKKYLAMKIKKNYKFLLESDMSLIRKILLVLIKIIPTFVWTKVNNKYI